MTYQDVMHHYVDPPSEEEERAQGRSDTAKGAPRCQRTGRFLPWHTPVTTDEETGREYVDCPAHGQEAT